MDKFRILIVDDDKLIIRQIFDEFKNANFEIEFVENAEKAIIAFQKQAFNLVFTDLVLPGKNGVELCSEIKKLNPQTEVVLMSGRPSEIEKLQLVFLNVGGRDESLRKPLIADEILNVAKKIRKEREEQQR